MEQPNLYLKDLRKIMLLDKAKLRMLQDCIEQGSALSSTLQKAASLPKLPVWPVSCLSEYLSDSPSTATSCSPHPDLLSYPVHLHSCCFVAKRRVQEVAIQRPHLLSSPLLQQCKQLSSRSLIIHNLLFPA